MDPQQLVQRAIQALSIKNLTPVQEELLSLRLTDENIIVNAPTGSGKTLGFILNVVSAMKPSDKSLQTVIIVPTRELAIQVASIIHNIISGLFKIVVCYGGHPFAEEERSLSTGADIIVATPGRLLDHIKRKSINVKSTRYLILDEYDKSLELGFTDEMKQIVRNVSDVKRIVMTSATALDQLPDWLPPKKIIYVTDKSQSNDSIRGKAEIIKVKTHDKDKLHVLNDLLRNIGGQKTIIFVNHRESAERVTSYLRKLHFPVGIYHGGMEQIERENSLEMFANGTHQILISTDLGARGIDMSDISNIIHYHLPTSEQAMIHRNGRTSRMGGVKGNIFAIVSDEENEPEFISFSRSWYPPHVETTSTMNSEWSTVWFGAGKKDKLSKGDIVGFLIQSVGLTANEIGRITLRDHNALVAVKRSKVQQIVDSGADSKIKGKKIRISRLSE